LGLKAAKDMNVKHLEVFGDSELVVSQVKDKYKLKQIRLKQYKNEVCDLIERDFLAFNLSFVPRAENQLEDSLTLAASGLRARLVQHIKYEVQMKYIPSIPDNIKHWKVFQDDKEIDRFLPVIDKFCSVCMDQENLNDIPSDDTPSNPADPPLLKKIVSHKILELKMNHILGGLVPLERLFERNDITVSPEKQTNQAAVSDFNIGTDKEPKFFKLSKYMSDEERNRYLDLMKEFKDIFA